jgi:aminoglycoside N3'-acetyltransferase
MAKFDMQIKALQNLARAYAEELERDNLSEDTQYKIADLIETIDMVVRSLKKKGNKNEKTKNKPGHC